LLGAATLAVPLTTAFRMLHASCHQEKKPKASNYIKTKVIDRAPRLMAGVTLALRKAKQPSE